MCERCGKFIENGERIIFIACGLAEDLLNDANDLSPMVIYNEYCYKNDQSSL